jgi:3-hydroxybutyryl-CoA dehydrogenase
MKASDIKNIAVIGLGTMGPGIIQSFAQAGFMVKGFDVNPEAAPLCARIIRTNLGTLQEFNLATGAESEAAIARTSYVDSLAEAVKDADIVVEAVSENVDIKRQVFAEIDAAAPEGAFIWSNTSTLNIYDLVPEARQERTVIAHWFAPPHIIPLVEVVKGPKTADQTVDLALTLLEQQDKKPIVIEKYVPGFIINRILRNLGREAFFLLDNGYISAEDLDLAVKASIAPRMMVLGLIQRYDFTGLDLSARNLLDESFFDPPIDNRPESLQSRIDKGDLGVKTGRGFFDYSDRELAEINRDRDRYLLQVMQGVGFCLEKKRLV